MPISTATHPAIEDAFNRIAAESILAQVGRDDGLVPACSLLGDLIDLCAENTIIQHRVVATRTALETLLIKNPGAFLQNFPGVSGGAILEDGNIALTLDPGSLLGAAA